ncbi:unnamed protein product [Miscanthus lutarioriparius]|uniref:Uncharacterized protein n=1 Tax=Miscanthus lutarioriparius TaxID=422564 RepID=A0A811RRY5_9POAL|nr:unnamed protein product [Miscanthus lutarioriparius]
MTISPPDLILQSLLDSFEQFIMNYHMNGLKKTLTELHGMLKTVEVSLRKAPGHVMTVQKGKKQKRPAKAKKPAKSHIGKKRIERLHKDGLLDSFHYESIETFESCLLGKMTKAPFVGEKRVFSKEVSGSIVRLEDVRETQENVLISTDKEVQQDEPAIVANQHAEPQPRRSIRAHHAPKKYTLMTMG